VDAVVSLSMHGDKCAFDQRSTFDISQSGAFGQNTTLTRLPVTSAR